MLTLWIVDAFTNRPFAGNPAAVCHLDGPVPDPWMQSLAMEMNQAETAFLQPTGDSYRLRWFTPAIEVDLCGHATLASAHFLWASGRLPADRTARFDTRSGRLEAARTADGITLDFPATPPVPVAPPAELLPALGIARADVLINQVAQPDYLVVLEDPSVLRSLRPKFGGLRDLAARGVIVTAPGDRPGVDFVSRFFAPAAGIDEDPVTGSAHCTLAPYWSARLGRPALQGFQASPRGGLVGTRHEGNRVILSGQACTVLQGTIDGP
jgi:PhzF family phenazine biosynthesis protein